MQYITGLYALNIPCKLNTSGDWHRGSLDWDNPTTKESTNSIFGDWGLEPYRDTYKANHLRAILDIMEDGEKLPLIDNFHSDFISSSEYDEIFKEKVSLLKDVPHWREVECLMDNCMPRKRLSREELIRNGKLRQRRRTH